MGGIRHHGGVRCLGGYHGRHWMPHVMPPVDLDYPPHWWIQGGCHPCMPPNRIQFFHFRICFHQKVPTLEVGAPQQLGAPQWEILDPPLLPTLRPHHRPPHPLKIIFLPNIFNKNQCRWKYILCQNLTHLT